MSYGWSAPWLNNFKTTQTGLRCSYPLNFRMSSTPADFYAIAKRIATDESASEIHHRCAISRAYYSALHATDAAFPKTEQDHRRDGESSHAEIIGRAERYGRGLNPGRTEAALIARHLQKLRRFRNKADYELESDIFPEDSSSVLAIVKDVLDSCAIVNSKVASAASETAGDVRKPALRRLR